MRILFFSDVHGVAEALEQLWNQANALHPDCCVLLGDALYHGPRNGVPVHYDPVKTAELLNAHRSDLLAVRGNCDAEVDQQMLNFPILAPYSEILTDERRFFLTHGHLWNEDNLPPGMPSCVLVQGHTHIPTHRELSCGGEIFNPGSIALPKGGFPRSFGFYDGNALTVRALDDGTLLAL